MNLLLDFPLHPLQVFQDWHRCLFALRIVWLLILLVQLFLDLLLIRIGNHELNFVIPLCLFQFLLQILSSFFHFLLFLIQFLINLCLLLAYSRLNSLEHTYLVLELLHLVASLLLYLVLFLLHFGLLLQQLLHPFLQSLMLLLQPSILRLIFLLNPIHLSVLVIEFLCILRILPL